MSIFAAQVLLALAVGVHAVRLARGRARLESLPVDAPLLAFATWTLLSDSFSADPVASHEVGGGASHVVPKPWIHRHGELLKKWVLALTARVAFETDEANNKE